MSNSNVSISFKNTNIFDKRTNAIIIGSAACLIGVAIAGSFVPFGRGRHVGRINAIHKRGLLFKTHEVELMRTKNSTDSEGGLLHFSVPISNSESSLVLQNADKYLSEGAHVEVNYTSYLWNIIPTRGETSYHINSIKPL